MNLREAILTAKQQIDEGELPASESSRMLRRILNDETIVECPHLTESGCSLIDICVNHPYGGAEPF